MIYGNGTVYEGNWYQGKQDGKGYIAEKGGKRQDGNWERGVIVNRI